MQAPLRPVPVVPPLWVRTTTSSGAFSAMTDDQTPLLPGSAPETPEPTPPAPAATPFPEPNSSETDTGFRPLPPPPPEQFPTIRSEDGRVALTNDALELNGELFGWRELEGVDVRPVRWLLGVLLGAFVLCGFLLGFLQYWLRSLPAALGMGVGIMLLAWGARGTNRWRLHRPGREPRHFAFSGGARTWQQLAQEANRRIQQRHNEAAADAAYWLHATSFPGPTPSGLPSAP
ncbi:hypothetical protein GCM10027348_12090 [Hymenobacter tenuis]